MGAGQLAVALLKLLRVEGLLEQADERLVRDGFPAGMGRGPLGGLPALGRGRGSRVSHRGGRVSRFAKLDLEPSAGCLVEDVTEQLCVLRVLDDRALEQSPGG